MNTFTTGTLGMNSSSSKHTSPDETKYTYHVHSNDESSSLARVPTNTIFIIDITGSMGEMNTLSDASRKSGTQLSNLDIIKHAIKSIPLAKVDSVGRTTVGGKLKHMMHGGNMYIRERLLMGSEATKTNQASSSPLDANANGTHITPSRLAAVIDLLGEIEGRVLKSFVSLEHFTKWVEHYCPAIAQAYELQRANSLKDLGVQHYTTNAITTFGSNIGFLYSTENNFGHIPSSYFLGGESSSCLLRVSGDFVRRASESISSEGIGQKNSLAATGDKRCISHDWYDSNDPTPPNSEYDPCGEIQGIGVRTIYSDSSAFSDSSSSCTSNFLSYSTSNSKRRKPAQKHYSIKAPQKNDNPRPKKAFDVFVSYKWGKKRGQIWPNQQRVLKIVNIMRGKGYTVWLDNDNCVGMSTGIEKAQADGIESSKLFLCFMTKDYYESVNKGDTRDPCCFEFMHAFRHMGNQKMKTIVLDKMVKKTASNKWKGVVDGCIGSQLYFDMSDPKLYEDSHDAAIKLEAKFEKLHELLI